MNNTTLTNFTDEELLHHVYNSPELHSDLVMELSARLEHALDELTRKPKSIGDIIEHAIDACRNKSK